MEMPGFRPKPVRAIEETGIPDSLVSDLFLKRVFLESTTNLRRMTSETKLDYAVVYTTFRNLQKQQLVEIKGMIDRDYEFVLTNKGCQMAEQAYLKSRYAGPAPVGLEEYRRAICAQVFHPQVTQQSLAETLSDLVITKGLIRDLGAALMTGGAIFIYGPTGNGKTSIAERLSRIYHDYVFIPYAVEVSGHVLNVFDAISHRAVKEQPEDIDPRWLLCQRPFLTVGGEMRAHMLDPHIDENTHITWAPLQMKANNGILVIDDFGRQQIQPTDLLNRWVMPLDRHVDYLSMWSGVTFEIPFELLLVFATNLTLSSLAEEAFLRRIKNKIKVDMIGSETFDEIMQRQCRQRGIEYNAEVGGHALSQCLQHSKAGLRACYPKDLLDIVCGIAEFERRPPKFDRNDMDEAIGMYFLR